VLERLKAEHDAEDWQAAIQALLLVAACPTMFARIGVMRALNPHVERVFNPDRKDQHGDAGSWRGIDEVGVLGLPPVLRGGACAATRQLS
jgi:hypothetical protein